MDGIPDGALAHAFLPGNLPYALAEDQVGIHPAALDLRQGVKGVPEPDEQIHSIQKFLGRRFMQAGRVFNPVITVQGIISLVVIS